MRKATLEWDEEKDRPFLTPTALTGKTLPHSTEEDRYYCMGRVDEGILTLRFICGGNVTLIYGVSIIFFKEQAKKQKTSYQKMIREVVDWYASHYQKSA
jgi:uncharacterized DUF497 family protein